MVGTLVKKLFGSRNQRVLKRYKKLISDISAKESTYQALELSAFVDETAKLKARIAEGAAIDSLLPEAFALVREASVRTLGLRHFDVQMMGGVALHQGKIAEMQTGEGKTLVATLPAYLNALSGDGVHIVTVNDYLAQRDADWMRPIYELLGLSVSSIVSGMTPPERKAAYECDIVYCTNNELGFDYLRDNMAFSLEEKVQRNLNFAVVDEVDSILIDEARTPLIISGQVEDGSELYRKVNTLIPKLTRQEDEEEPGDYTLDEKAKQVLLTEQGNERVESLLVEAGLLDEAESLYSSANISLLHHVNAALRAHTLFKRDVDYIVKDNQIVIIDEHTGRMMPGRRWSDGLHQAVEAREGVAIQSESQTLASITFQNYFRLYNKLAGMTGTADTEAHEFQTIYDLEVISIPPNKPNQRDDASDLVFMNTEDKFKAIIEDINESSKLGRPILVGTASIETSEFLSKVLTQSKIKHSVLNAKHHEREAQIIAEAGRPGAVTIATNMAGRGTDIVLGGSLEAELAVLEDKSEIAEQAAKKAWQERHDAVVAAGGLRIIGTERHESRRIDNQLRGRAGRQGDPGSSRFYLSLEDNLIRIFASDRMTGLMQRFGFEEGEAIEHPWLTRAIENAQRKVEGHNFDIRKQLLDFDNVANDQRTVIYAQRSELMAQDDISETIESVRHDVVSQTINAYIPPQSIEDMWDVKGLEQQLEKEFSLKLPVAEWLDKEDDLEEQGVRQRIVEKLQAQFDEKADEAGVEVMRHFEKAVMLQVLDKCWREHLAAMDYLRQAVGFRSYAQKNPMQEYKREAFELFSQMLDAIKYEVITILSKVKVRAEEDVEAIEAERRQQALKTKMNYQHKAPESSEPTEAPEELHAKPFVREGKKVGRNEPCPCGSGKKYKQCHGKI